MDSSPVVVDQATLETLPEKDKAELRQFLAHEQQRTRVQSQTHVLTEMCWKKCIANPITKGTLSGTEEACMANCVDRFLDFNFLTANYLAQRRQQ